MAAAIAGGGVPLTAKLSRKFYETFGDEIANDFVGWFNSVDAQYRTELRELLDSQFRLMRTELEQRMDQRLSAVELRLERRIDALDRRIDSVESKLEKMEVRILARTETMFANAVGSAESRLQRWMIGLWLTTMLAVLGTRLL